MRRALRRFLKSPKVIVGEIAALALVCTAGAALPQVGSSTEVELARLRQSGPLVAALVEALALDRVFRSPVFLALCALAAASLLVVVLEQARRLRAQWSLRLTPSHFQGAPFRVEFVRPTAVPGAANNSTPKVEVWTERRVGLAGSVVFHGGLLLVMLAGALKALFGADAVVDLIEGETLPPTASAWAGQWPGLLARPVRLDFPLTLQAVEATRYADGDLRQMKVRLAVQRAAGPATAELAVNRDCRIAGERVFLTSDHGPAALLEWQIAGREPARQAALLSERGLGRFEGTASGPDGLRAHLRAHVGAAGHPPSLVEVRVMKQAGLLFTGDARVGDTLVLPGGLKLALRGLPFWARLRGHRDAFLGLAYTGFGLVLLGVTIMFTLIKVDGCLVVTSAGATEQVFLALKPHRSAPLFEERFGQLVHEQGGPARWDGSPAAGQAAGWAAEPGVPLTPPPVVAAGPLAGAWQGLTLWLMVAVCTLPLAGCQRSSFSEARRLVERYNHVVSEAYRRGDVKLIDPVVGSNEGRKITGLIGVRLDLGLTLDAQLLWLELTGVEPGRDELRVRTRERWRYRDRRIGTGEPVGEESLDSYEMLYVFKRDRQTWVVDEICFTAPPRVGRQQMSWLAERADGHGLGGQAGALETRQP